MSHLDTSKVINGKIYKTQCGDTVYGGGGITPKIFVGIDTGTRHQNVIELFETGLLNDFIYKYYINHIDEINKYTGPEEFIINYNNEEGRWKELVNNAAKEHIDLTVISPADKDFLQRRIKAQLARYKWRSEGFYEVINSFDPAIKKALEELQASKRRS